MNNIAVILIVISALIHACWNYDLKKAINNGADSVLILFLSILAGNIIYAVVFFVMLLHFRISAYGFLLAAMCGFFLALYFFLLSKSYSIGDMSQVYPLAKITPLFTLLIGYFYLNETITLISVIGIVCITFGVYSITLKSFKNIFKPFLHTAAIFALATAAVSSLYGLVSKLGSIEINAFMFVWLAFTFSSLFYLPALYFKNSTILSQWKKYKGNIVRIGILDLLGYSLIVVALSLSNLSSVFALRQMSILVGVLMGIFLLKEKHGFVRIVSAVVIFVGIVLVSVG